MKKTISTDKAPAAIGPYSQAVSFNDLVFCSGQIPLDPVSGDIVGEDTASQMKQVMKNLGAVLDASGSGWDKVLKCTIYLVDMADFTVVNEIYAEYFTENPPAREAVAVRTLPRNVRVEVSCFAFRQD